MLASLLLAILITPAAQPAAEWLPAKLETIRAKRNVPSMAAVIVINGQVVATGAVGVKAKGKADSVQISDRYHYGSNTKSMTATLLAFLVEQGKLKWTTTLGEMFKDSEVKEPYRKVTIGQLLAHRAGLSNETYFKDGPDYFTDKRPIKEQRWEFALRALSEDPVATPGQKMIYSNRGYVIAGAIAEKVTGETYEDLMARLLFKPLGMKTAGFGPVPTPGPLGHTKEGTPVPPGPYADNAPVTYPAGGLHATVLDMAKYVSFHAGVGPILLKQSTLNFLHEAQGGDYACGWIVLNQPWANGPLLGHSGSNTINYADVWVAPGRKLAMVIATNQGDDEAKAAVKEAGTMMTNELFTRGYLR